MRFYHILHKNSIGHLLRTSRDYFRKEMDNIYVHFLRVFVEFVVLLTKIWPTNIDFNVTATCRREGYFWPPPPFLHQEVIDAI